MSFYWRTQQALVKVKQNFQITIPVEVREQLRVKEGDYLEATVRNDVVVLTPKAVVDRHVNDAIAEGMKDYREGRFIGPFESVEEFKDTEKKHSRSWWFPRRLRITITPFHQISRNVLTSSLVFSSPTAGIHRFGSRNMKGCKRCGRGELTGITAFISTSK